MALYRVNIDGSLTELLLGIVTSEGVDFGQGNAISYSISVHEFKILGSPAELGPVLLSAHEFNIFGTYAALPETFIEASRFMINGKPLSTRISVHKFLAFGVAA